MMWGRGRNKASPVMVPTWGRSSRNRGMGCSSSLSRTRGRTALGSSRGGGGRRGHSSYGGNSKGRRSSGGSRARVRPAGRERRGAAHLRSKAVFSTCLHHGWAREGEERMGCLGVKMKGGGGGGGGGGV